MSGAAAPAAVASEPIQPTYRGTRESAAMQQALRHAASGNHAEQANLFHTGRLPWQAAVAAASGEAH